MSKKISISILLLLVIQSLSMFAQKDRVLFTLNGNKVYNSEFSRVYEKNLSIVNDPAQKDIDNYLDLYINYRLKLQEAYDLKMDTVSSYIAEYNKYKNQLLEPYMNDDNKEKDLVKEAYDRMTKEVNASHILLKLGKNMRPEDTLKIYNKINDFRNQILSGQASFDSIAKNFSEDPSAKTNNGNLGYFTVFQMVYPFETVAYTTPVGEVSKVFRTRFGYHIIKVHDVRDARGEVEVAHIMLKGDTPENREKIKKIKKQLDEGADFAELAKNYSADIASAAKGGVLPKFTANKMVKDFSDVAFSLKNPGDISEPFTTRFGWHIVKLIRKIPVGSFDEVKSTIEKKVQRGQRAKIIGRSVIDRLLKEYDIKVDDNILGLFSNNKKVFSKKELDQTLLTIQDKQIPAEAFKKYLDQNNKRKEDIRKTFQKFKEKEVLAYYREQLPAHNPDLAGTLREYREGLLLFDLMQKRIWLKAEEDSIGLKNFFEKNAGKYRWKEKVDAVIFTLNKKENADEALKLLKQGTDIIEIQKQLSKKGIVDLKHGAFEKTSPVFPENYDFKIGISDVLPEGKQFKIIQIKSIEKDVPKELSDARGKVISDYQDYLEKEWLESLHKKYPVVVNKKALKKLKKKYK